MSRKSLSRSSVTRLMTVVLVCAFLFYLVSPAVIGQPSGQIRDISIDSPTRPETIPPSDELWKAFRSANPFHTQVIALSAADSGGGRTLIISEPPPDVNFDAIRNAAGAALTGYKIEKHPIGYDGWVKDVVLTVHGTDDEIAPVLSRLNQTLFHTSYKSYIVPLGEQSASASPPITVDLDLDITPTEIENWLKDPAERFSPVVGGRKYTLAQLVKTGFSEVYSTSTRGLVLWWIPKGKSIDDSRMQARQFALDSDLIVGAISRSPGLMILGRVRSVPVTVLPPLRTETIRLLADAATGDNGGLKQSYERNHPLSGRYEGYDWAPILLSPELRNTEYGSLLNITDQLLKGWSNKGETTYYNFPYRAPEIFPFEKPLLKEVGAHEIRYNWNTDGSGYVLSTTAGSTYALNRTGALPITYLSDQLKNPPPEMVGAAERAGNYFAARKDPQLVRVVQYAAIYQIFSAFGVTKSSVPLPATSVPDETLDRIMPALVTEIRDLGPADRDKLVKELTPLYEKLIAKEIENVRTLEMPEFESMLIERGLERGTPKFKEALDLLIPEVDKLIEAKIASDTPDGPPVEAADTVRAAIDELGRSANVGDTIRSWRYAADIRGMKKVLVWLAFIGLRKVPQEYVEKNASETGWIHTPVIVLSRNIGTMSGATGGHNLDARTTRFRIGSVPPGYRVYTDRTGFVVRGQDAGNIRALNQKFKSLRKTASDDLTLLREMNDFAATLPPPVSRSMPTALRFSNKPPEPPKPLVRSGWAGTEEPIPPDRLARNQADQQATAGLIAVKKHTERDYEIVVPGGEKSIKVSTKEDAADAVVCLARSQTDPVDGVRLELRSFDADGPAFLNTVKLRAADAGVPNEIEAFVSKELGDADLAGLAKTPYIYSAAKYSEGLSSESSRTIVVDIPSAQRGPSGTFEATITFKPNTDPAVATRSTATVRTRIQAVLSRLTARVNVLVAGFKLRREINKIARDTGLGIDEIRLLFRQGAGPGIKDLYWTKVEHERSANGDRSAE